MTRPYTDAASIAMTTSQVQRSWIASIRVFSIASPRHRDEADPERHAQQLVEDEVAPDRRQDCERDCKLQPCTERGRGRKYDQPGGQDETEPFGREHVEQEERRWQQRAQAVEPAALRDSGLLAGF